MLTAQRTGFFFLGLGKVKDYLFVDMGRRVIGY
jgi:hypothetical protein